MKRLISQDEINGILWRACDTFRGTIDPAFYKDYILVMWFVKYISDLWHAKRKYEQYREQYQGNEARIERRLRREK